MVMRLLTLLEEKGEIRSREGFVLPIWTSLNAWASSGSLSFSFYFLSFFMLHLSTLLFFSVSELESITQTRWL